MANFSLSVTPAKPRIDVTPPDFGITIFANRSTFGLFHLLPDQDITLTLFNNVSEFPPLILQEGPAEGDISLVRFNNTTTFGLFELDEAPPDENIRLTKFNNTTTFGSHELAEAPPDANIRLTKFNNTTTFGTLALSTDGSDSGDDYDAIIGGQPIGGVPE